MQDNLPAAEQMMKDALGRAMAGSGDRALWLHLTDLQASLLNHQRRYAEAIRLLGEVHAGYLVLGDEHLAARSLLTLGICVGFARSPEEALAVLEQAAVNIHGPLSAAGIFEDDGGLTGWLAGTIERTI
jgi:hypothetical protein